MELKRHNKKFGKLNLHRKELQGPEPDTKTNQKERMHGTTEIKQSQKGGRHTGGSVLDEEEEVEPTCSDQKTTKYEQRKTYITKESKATA